MTAGDPKPLEASGLKHSFSGRRALDGLSLSIEPGTVFGLVGPDGAGKTTALRIFGGLIDPNAGSVRVFGRDPRDATARDLIGYMPQMYSLYGDLSVIENLKFFGRMFRITGSEFEARAERLLSLTRLKEFPDRRADALSGGMYKKLALAAALLSRPGLLLLDEPTNGVDPVSRGELWDLLYEFVAEGSTVMVSTAYMDEAARCSRVGLLFEGRLAAEGAPFELRRSFSGTVYFVSGSGGSSDEIRTAMNANDMFRDQATAITPSGDGFRLLATGPSARALGTRLSAAGLNPEVVEPSFEDIYICLTAASATESQNVR